MSDAEKCKLIREFEGIYANDILTADYPHDLRATMRAARRLPDDAQLIVTSLAESHVLCTGTVYYCSTETRQKGDIARAAFEALAAYLAKERP